MSSDSAHSARNRRRAELAKIHISAKALGMDEQTYRDMLWAVAQVRSAADLDATTRQAVLDHLRALMSTTKRCHTVAADRAPLVSKIRALLASAKPRRGDEYADALAHRMFHVQRYEWCTPDQLRRLVAALNYDAQRRRSKVSV